MPFGIAGVYACAGLVMQRTQMQATQQQQAFGLFQSNYGSSSPSQQAREAEAPRHRELDLDPPSVIQEPAIIARVLDLESE